MITRLLAVSLRAGLFVGLVFASAAPLRSQEKLPSLDEVVKAKLDLWGEAAMRQPNGPSCEFFENLLPPPRYVNADFHYYPIVLSAPNAKVKARLISNGSGINLRGGARSWNDNGTPVTFRVGPDEFVFGSLRDRLTHPTLAEGYLPIAEVRYLHGSPAQAEGNVPLNQKRVDRAPEIYRLEAFASSDPALAENGVALVKFSLAQGSKGFVAVQLDSLSPVKFANGKVTDDQGRVLAWFDKAWKWERQRATTRLTEKSVATLAVATKPLDAAGIFNFTASTYDAQRETCARTWRQILAQGMNVETPEPYVNDAWRHLLIQNFELINGDRIHYSAGNQYDKLYESEGSDAALAMMWWGYERDMRRLLVPLLDFTRKGLEFHQAGFKLNDLCRYYWQTRDAAVVRELRPRWEREAKRLTENRTGDHGLFPKEQYCGDISTPVQSLNANAKAWRALRDLSAVLDETGERAEADHYAGIAADFKKAVLTAIEKSVRRDTSPPFIPVALYADEPPHDPICDVRIGSYWNIIIGYTIGSGIFPPGSEEETWIPRYQEQHGGLCMGMVRSGGSEFNFWSSEHRVNPLYGTRYALDTLRRDDPERALVSFYGMLAQGFTRNTFVCGEGCTLTPVDEGGRFFYCPPNSAANAHFLSMLRHLLVQDFDLDNDGRPETLRLLYGASRRWLEDGKTLKVERAPTAFGQVSVLVRSELSAGRVLVDLDLPTRHPPSRAWLRLRLPEGWRVDSARSRAATLSVDAQGSVDISVLKGKNSVVAQVVKSK